MNKKILTALCVALLCNFPLCAEARGGGWDGVIKKIIDPAAMDAYAKEVAQLKELLEQGQKMQTQINQMQQSLEHFKFENLEGTYNMLTGTMDDFEALQRQYIGMNITAQEMKDNWDELNENYDSKTMTPEELEELKKKQEARKKASAEYTAKWLARLEDTQKARAELNQYKQELMKLDDKNVKSSPIKAIQILGQLMTFQANELKKQQKAVAEQIRQGEDKKLTEDAQKKIEKKEREMNGELTGNIVKDISKDDNKTKYDNPFMTAEDYARVNRK